MRQFYPAQTLNAHVTIPEWYGGTYGASFGALLVDREKSRRGEQDERIQTLRPEYESLLPHCMIEPDKTQITQRTEVACHLGDDTIWMVH